MKVSKILERKPYEKEAKTVLHTDGSAFQKKWTEEQMREIFDYANPGEQVGASRNCFERFLKLLVWLETIQ